MKKIHAFRFLLTMLVFLSVSGCSEDDPGVSSSLDINLDAAAILQIVNQHRAAGATCGEDQKSPVANLIWSDELALAALDHSNDMQTNDYFSHTSQDGRKFSERARTAGFEGSPVGENIALGYPTEEAVMQGWMDSPGHCRNIMNGNATHIGIAKSAEGNYWTMVLGRL